MFSYIKKIQSFKITFSDFFLKRWTRLFPLMLIGAISAGVVLYIYNQINQVALFQIEPTIFGVIITALGIQDGWVFGNPMINNPTWYISVLLLCYIFFYIVTYYSKKFNIPYQYSYILIVLIGIGIQTWGINKPFINYSSSRGLIAFFFGLLLADFLNNRGLKKKYSIVSFLIILSITLLFIYQPDVIYPGIYYIMIFVYYPAVIIFCKSSFVSIVTNRKIFGTLGKISFDVYILHTPLNFTIVTLISVGFITVDMHSYVVMFVSAIIFFIIGAVCYYLVEKPTSKMMDRLLRKNNVKTDG